MAEDNAINKMILVVVVFSVLFLSVGNVSAISQTVNVNVIETNDININFVRLDGPTGFNNVVPQAISFLERIYPVSNQVSDSYTIASGEIDSTKMDDWRKTSKVLREIYKSGLIDCA